MIIFNENVLRFQVPVDNPVLVKVQHSIEYLGWVILDFVQGEFFFLLNNSWKISSCIIRDNNDFLWGLNYVFKTDNVGVIYLFEQLVLLSEIFEISGPFLPL